MNELIILANDLRNCANGLDECILLTGRKQLTKIVEIRNALRASADVIDRNDLYDDDNPAT